MAVTLIPLRHSLDATKADVLRKLLVSSEFSLLKEVMVANCVIAQLASMNALVYPESEAAKADMVDASKDAIKLNAMLDLLDDLAKNEDKWFTVTIEPSR